MNVRFEGRKVTITDGRSVVVVVYNDDGTVYVYRDDVLMGGLEE